MGCEEKEKKAISIIPWLATQTSHCMLPRKKKREACITEPMLRIIIKVNDDIHLECSIKGCLKKTRQFFFF